MGTSYNKVTLRSGGAAIVFEFDGGKDYPQIGAWWADTQERWIPCAWTVEGYLLDATTQTELDILLDNSHKE